MRVVGYSGQCNSDKQVIAQPERLYDRGNREGPGTNGVEASEDMTSRIRVAERNGN